jgi:hypothetical protein
MTLQAIAAMSDVLSPDCQQWRLQAEERDDGVARHLI